MALRGRNVYVKCSIPKRLKPYIQTLEDSEHYLMCFHATASRVLEEVAFLHFTVWPVLGGSPCELSHKHQVELHQGLQEMLLECRNRLFTADPPSPRPDTVVFVEHRETATLVQD